MAHIADMSVDSKLTNTQINQIAEGFQAKMDIGHFVGRLVTGDHDDNEGNVIFDWSEFGRE